MVEYHVPSVELATKVLKLLSRYKYRNCTLKEISDRLSVNKTTCLRVLRTLEREDFLRYNAETKKYCLGPFLIPLGNRAAELSDWITFAKVEMAKVAERTGLTTVLVERLQNDQLVYLASAEPPNGKIKISVSVGQYFPITVTAFGRAYLAYDDESEWQRLIRKGIRPITSNTVTDGEAFVEAIRQTQRVGYAVSHGEATPGISAIAAPIIDHNKNVVLVMACIVMTTQYENAVVATGATNVLLEATRKLSSWT